MTTEVIPRGVVVMLCINMAITALGEVNDAAPDWWWWMSAVAAIWWLGAAVALVIEGVRQRRRA